MSVSLEEQHLIEQYLYREAKLLDNWQLDEWLSLFTDDCAYEVTPPGEADPESLSAEEVFFLIADDRERLEQRIIRIKSPAAHVENPRSKVRHIYSNPLVEHCPGGYTVHVNFVVYRNRDRITHAYMGGIRFDLVGSSHSLKINRKRAMPDMDALVPQGKMSIFL